MTTAAIKSRLESLSPEEFINLQNAQKYRRFVSNMRSNGWLNLVLGLINVWLGDFYQSGDLISLFMMIFGFALIGVSLWLIVSPSNQAALAFMVIMLIAGGYNVGFSALNGLLWVPGILGVLQLKWAFQLFYEYQEWQKNSVTTPSEEILHFTKLVRRAFTNAQFQYDADLIKFRIKRHSWRAWLLGDYGVVVNYKWDRANPLILRRAEVDFEPHDDRQLSRNRINGVFKLGDDVSWGDIKSESFDRFHQWKSNDVKTPHLMDFYAREQRIPLLMDKAFQIVAILIISGALLCVGSMILLVVSYGG